MNSSSGIDTHELVSSKENIQPLRRGRDTTILCAALHAENDAEFHQELEKQRNEFEIRLRSENTEDPLSDWCAYIHWIEQWFPKQGKEGNLHVVLRKCIVKFKDCERYLNDIRFVKLCIKYADIEGNSVELLGQIYKHGIGVLCAEFYITWAEKYTVDNCYKKANKIYGKGFKCQAQPMDLLKQAYQNFQAFLVRKMLNEEEIFQPTMLDSNSSEARQPYNMLQSMAAGNKELVPSVRTGQNVLGTAGKLLQNSNFDSRQKSNKMIKVYEDSENAHSMAEPQYKMEKVPTKESMTKENTVKPGPWTNKQKKRQPFKIEAAAPLPFQVHRDEENEASEKKPRSVPASVLKSHKASYEDENFENAPLFYAEPYDPTKRAIYCKDQVYAGGLEFQFEELRAMRYRKRSEELLAKGMKTLEVVPANTPELASSEVAAGSSLKSNSQLKKKSEEKCHKLTETRRKTLFKNPSSLHSDVPKTNYVPEENIATTDYSMNQTIHTKEALSEMQQLWFSKPASPVALPAPALGKPAAKSILKQSTPCFSLYVDESCLENVATSKNADKPLDLTFRLNSENEEANHPVPRQGPKKKGLANKIKCFSENFKENIIVEKAESKDEGEDKENGVPADYCGPVGKSCRKVSGILTPAENIEIAPLSDEEVEEDEDEDEDEEEGEVENDPSIIGCNATEITETWNFTKNFQFPRGESTPNVQKFVQKKETCDDSVFANDLQSPCVTATRENDVKPGETNKKTMALNPESKKTFEAINYTKNLSVIVENSREYKSSSSGSSGLNTLPSRHSKNFLYTPSASQTTMLKTKCQSLTGYEASEELSQNLKTTSANILNVTYDLMNKLNAVESCTLSICEREEEPADEEKKQLENANEKLEKDEENIDPFSDELLEKLLKNAKFPKDIHWSRYFLFDDMEMVSPRVNSSVTLGCEKYDVKSILGEGSYARVYKLVNSRTKELMVGKFQKPAFPWEFYIVREVHDRLQDKALAVHFMDVESAYFFKNSSILLSKPAEYGDLLSVINKMNQAKILSHKLALFFTCQILKMVETLHSCKIIHGDIKPDNLLLRDINNTFQLQLIDFGRSIDMSLFPENTTFKKVVTTEGFTTIEMRFNKPWTYQIDLYGVANCAHCLLFGDYMKVVEKGGIWTISKFIHRYWAKKEWQNFFTQLINIESCTKLPNLTELRKAFEGVLDEDYGIEYNLSELRNLLQSK